MSSEKYYPQPIPLPRSARLALALLLVGLFPAGGARAEGAERRGPFLLPPATPYERPAERMAREMPAFVPEPVRRQEPDEFRSLRRWSPEERRQLRQDVHDAGRDIYGGRPRRD